MENKTFQKKESSEPSGNHSLDESPGERSRIRNSQHVIIAWVTQAVMQTSLRLIRRDQQTGPLICGRLEVRLCTVDISQHTWFKHRWFIQIKKLTKFIQTILNKALRNRFERKKNSKQKASVKVWARIFWDRQILERKVVVQNFCTRKKLGAKKVQAKDSEIEKLEINVFTKNFKIKN